MRKSAPITWSSHRRAVVLPNCPARPACAGRSRSVSNVQKRDSGSSIARPAPGTAGPGICPCAWQHSASLPDYRPSCAAWLAANRTKRVRQLSPLERPGATAAERAGDPLPDRSPVACPDQQLPLHPPLVVVAKTSPSGGSARPLPRTTETTSATVVLAVPPGFCKAIAGLLGSILIQASARSVLRPCPR